MGEAWGAVSFANSQRCSVELRLGLFAIQSKLGKLCLWSMLCTEGHWNTGTGLGLLVSVKENQKATTYKYIVDNHVPTLWQKFAEGPYIRAHT